MGWDWLTRKTKDALEADVEKNPLDKVIVEHGHKHPEVTKVYEARWVWYHTILAVEIFFTNVFLAAILVALLVIIAKM